MDPEANLREQRRLGADMNKIRDNCTDDGQLTVQQRVDLEHDAYRLAELVEALEGWIASGGFLPKAWKATRGGTNAVDHAIDLLEWWAEDHSDEPDVVEHIQQSKECIDELRATSSFDYAPLAEFLTDVIDYLDDR